MNIALPRLPLFALTLVTAVLTPLAAGCSAPVDSGSVGATSDDLTFLPPPAATTVILYSEVGFWGTSQTITLFPKQKDPFHNAPAGPASQPVAVQPSLRHAVSSAKIICGTSATDVVFVETDVSLAPSAAFSCKPGETKSINLHTTTAYPGGFTLGDRVDMIDAWVRPDVTGDYPLSRAVMQYWNDARAQIFTGWYAGLAKEPSFHFYDSTWFSITQEFNTVGSGLDAPISLIVYGYVVNDANGFHFTTELNYFSCTNGHGGPGWFSCGETVDQQMSSITLTLESDMNILGRAMGPAKSAFMFPTLGTAEAWIGLVK
jgi:hypothetical protein